MLHYLYYLFRSGRIGDKPNWVSTLREVFSKNDEPHLSHIALGKRKLSLSHPSGREKRRAA